MVPQKIKLKLRRDDLQAIAVHLEDCSRNIRKRGGRYYPFYYSFCVKFARDFLKKWVSCSSDSCTFSLFTHDAITLKEVLCFYTESNNPNTKVLLNQTIGIIDQLTS